MTNQDKALYCQIQLIHIRYGYKMEFYTLHICGLIRKLPLVYVGRHTRLANFTILGDVELTDALADTIAGRLKSYRLDYLVGPEVKVVPLIHGVAKRLGHKKFVVCRKSMKPYMADPVVLKPLPYFPKHVKQLVLNGVDAALLKGKNVGVMDDVLSTGVTMRMMHKLMENIGAKVIVSAVVLTQGVAFDTFPNLIRLGSLPIMKDTH